MESVLYSKTALGSAIRAARRAKGWTQTELAREMGVPQSWISSLERGATNPTFDSLMQVLAALELELATRPRAVSDEVDWWRDE